MHLATSVFDHSQLKSPHHNGGDGGAERSQVSKVHTSTGTSDFRRSKMRASKGVATLFATKPVSIFEVGV